MKPKGTSEHYDGLLEYHEDIIGTAALNAPIELRLLRWEGGQIADRRDSESEVGSREESGHD
jgi:hypothetical protein